MSKLIVHPRSYEEITQEEAKILYCNSLSIYVTTEQRDLWKLPPSYEYGSHAPIEDLFYRSVPQNEGQIRFYKQIN